MVNEEHAAVAKCGAILWIEYVQRRGGADRRAFKDLFSSPLLPPDFPDKLLDALSTEGFIEVDNQGHLRAAPAADEWIGRTQSLRKTIADLTSMLAG